MRYRAFISYASADRETGQRFQREIEHFRIPRPLRGTDYGSGAVPRHLTPLFRDRADADASHNLTGTLHAALENSDALVVLCSPASARSPWVNAEIRIFAKLGRGHRIFPVLIEGLPVRFDAETAPAGAFPPALFERFDAAGNLIAADKTEPLAADIRDSGDGWYFSKLKVIAGLTGVPLTLLSNRHQEAERRERLMVRWVAGVMASLALVAGVTAVLAWRSEGRARDRLEDAIEMAARRVDDAARFQDAYGVPTAVIRKLLSGAEHDFDTLIRAPDTRSHTLELQRGRLLALFSDLYRTVGERERQLELARESVAVLGNVVAERRFFAPATWFARLPLRSEVETERLAALESLGLALDDAGMAEEASKVFEQGRQLAVASSNKIRSARFWSRLGEHRYLAGDLDGALAAHDSAIAILREEIARGDDADARRDEAIARSDRAEMLLELGRHGDALEEQARATEAFEKAARQSPEDAAAQRSWAQALSRQGDMSYAASNDGSSSLALFTRAVDIFARTRASDPTRIDYARDLSIALERLGDARFQLHDLAAAKTHFDESLEIRKEILSRDPSNADARRDVAVALERHGDIALAAGTPSQALAAFDEARELRALDEPTGPDKAGESDPVFVRDIAVLWSRTAQARRAAGVQGWRDAHARAIELMSSLVEMQGALPGWMRDLAIFHTRYGDALRDSGERSEAVRQWRTALEVTQRHQATGADDPKLAADAEALQSRLQKAGVK
jgi:tetratricopeptide (TPR) repeat protein